MKVKIMKRTGSAILALSILAGGAAAVVPLTAESSIEVRAASTEKDFKTEKDSKGYCCPGEDRRSACCQSKKLWK